MINVKIQDVNAIPDNKAIPFINALTIQQLPPQKIKEMRDYAVKCRKKFPNMSPKRLTKRVSEHFNIELI